MVPRTVVQRLKESFAASVGTVVFGMEDGIVSIFGLVFGVAATTTSSKTVLIAGASGAAAAAVSMMAGAYLDVETTRDSNAARRASLGSGLAIDGGRASLLPRLAAVGLTEEQAAALSSAVEGSRDALVGLVLVMDGQSEAVSNPWEQALWMLLADFLAAAVPILPFVFLSIAQARIVAGAVTIALLFVLGLGRARIAKRNPTRTVVETLAVGVAAALAGVAISVLIDHASGL